MPLFLRQIGYETPEGLERMKMPKTSLKSYKRVRKNDPKKRVSRLLEMAIRRTLIGIEEVLL